jgi:hypothetical protein
MVAEKDTQNFRYFFRTIIKSTYESIMEDPIIEQSILETIIYVKHSIR